jgi:SAM-dependent methyltransferase
VITPPLRIDGAPGPVEWHDLECGSYRADLPLWRDLASRAGGRILDIGAGTGRVTIDLASCGHEVTALDISPVLLAELARRAGSRGLAVSTAVADARDFELYASFALCLVPMQTIQLLGGARGRGAFLAGARRHLRPGGLLAAAIANAREGYDPSAPPPDPDVAEGGGWRLESHPVALHDEPGGGTTIERLRTATGPDGQRFEEVDRVTLDPLDAATLEREGRIAGFEVRPRERIAATDVYVGSDVVMLRA